MIKTILIDDEKGARQGLLLTLQKYCPDVDVIAICETPEIGLEKINKLQPDLIFLDIQMPKMSGFELLKQLGDFSFNVIFVTAYDKYAIKAIKFSALDYLLKPIDVDELISSIEKVKNKKAENPQRYKSLLSNVNNSSEKLTRLAIPTDNEIIVQKINDIIYCEADSSYTTLHLVDNKRITVSKTLKEFESILPESDFCRIHHSSLVNMNHVIKYVKGEGGYVIITGGNHLNVSRRKKDSFIQLLSRG